MACPVPAGFSHGENERKQGVRVTIRIVLMPPLRCLRLLCVRNIGLKRRKLTADDPDNRGFFQCLERGAGILPARQGSVCGMTDYFSTHPAQAVLLYLSLVEPCIIPFTKTFRHLIGFFLEGRRLSAHGRTACAPPCNLCRYVLGDGINRLQRRQNLPEAAL